MEMVQNKVVMSVIMPVTVVFMVIMSMVIMPLMALT